MPNRWTRVPSRPVPALPPAARALIPVADLFMLAMVSRPASGSLRNTWVTAGTLELSLVVAILSLPTGFFLALTGLASRNALLLGLALAVVLLAAGAGAVAVVGITQRLEEGRRAG